MRLKYYMSTKPKVFALARRSFSAAFTLPDTAVLERKPELPLSDAYLEAIQREVDAKLGPASERKPVGPPGW